MLQDVSLSVGEGELVVLIGPNGHGKTTLLRAISGLVRARSGKIRLGDENLAPLRTDQIVDRGVVHIPQGDLLFPDMTVLDNLLMGAYLTRNRAEVSLRMEQVFALLPKLAERREQVAASLSGGERRMLGIGRGLMAGGRVLLIDEPSLGLAPIVIDQIYTVIGDLKKQGRTILLVEENTTRAMGIADHIYLLDNGCIVWHGAADEMAQRQEMLEVYLGG